MAELSPPTVAARLARAARGLRDNIVRYSIRLYPTEVQRTFGVTLVAGALCGLVAVAFHSAIVFVDRILIGRVQGLTTPWWVIGTLLCPALGGLVAGIVLARFPAARGSGIPQIRAAYAIQPTRVRLRDGFAKFMLTVLQVGSGASLGREGPTVQICAALSSSLGRWAALSPRAARRLLPVGAAAGVAAAFNAPIAAVTFTVEEIVRGLDQTVLSGVVVAAALAAVIEHTMLGSNPIFSLSRDVGLYDSSALIFYALLGLLAGVVAAAFTKAMLALRAHFRASRLPEWSRPAVGGLATGACAVAGLALVASRGVAGGGYTELAQALNGELPILTLLALGALKFAATLFSYSSGGVGGVFAPTLFLGAMLGGSVGWLDARAFQHTTTMSEFALVGMGAMFAGIIRAPITSVLIIFEMTGGYGLVLPLMIANTAAYLVARRFEPRGLYDALLEQDGVHLRETPADASRLGSLKVAQAMTTEPRVITANCPAAEAAAAMEAQGHTHYPVVDRQNRCVGTAELARVRRAVAEGHGQAAIASLPRLKEYLHPEDLLIRAVVRMNALGIRHLPVVEPGTLVLRGVLAMSDILRAQAQAAGDDEEAVTSARRLAPSSPEITR